MLAPEEAVWLFNLNGLHFCLKVAAMKTPTPEDDPMVSSQLQRKLCISLLLAYEANLLDFKE